MIVAGFNREEGASFPDNSQDFIRTMNESFKYSTLTGVRVESPTAPLDKKQIVELGLQLKAPFHLIYSCYKDSAMMCGICPSCLRIKNAFRSANAFQLIKGRFTDAT